MEIILTNKDMNAITEYINWIENNPDPCRKCTTSTRESCTSNCMTREAWKISDNAKEGKQLYEDEAIHSFITAYHQMIKAQKVKNLAIEQFEQKQNEFYEISKKYNLIVKVQ